ncbi:MAG: anthranilate synthase component II [Chloroflexota bacterium]
MLLLIDNYDSFTYNIYQYLCELGEEVLVVRNDRITVREVERMAPDRILVSPGPSTPEKAGVSNDIIRRFGASVPLMGVCLGHQCIGQVYGGVVRRAEEIKHGKASLIHHNGTGLFDGLPSPFSAIRYHSLVVEPESLPDCLDVTAKTDEGTIMGLRHTSHPVVGVQFHPESFMTEWGKNVLHNFVKGDGR